MSSVKYFENYVERTQGTVFPPSSERKQKSKLKAILQATLQKLIDLIPWGNFCGGISTLTKPNGFSMVFTAFHTLTVKAHDFNLFGITYITYILYMLISDTNIDLH